MSTFVRFETPYPCESSRQPMGVFGAASRVAARWQLPDWTREWLGESLRWFNDHLPVPSFDEPDPRAIFWFHPQTEVIREIWQLVAILREEEVPVRLRRTRLPGRIVYHDAFQIAAIPYGHGRRRKSRAVALH